MAVSQQMATKIYSSLYISGLDFAYSQVYVYLFHVLSPCGYIFRYIECIHFVQAPFSMKAVSQAMWLWTTAVGNLIVVIVAEGRLFKTTRSILSKHSVA